MNKYDEKIFDLCRGIDLETTYLLSHNPQKKTLALFSRKNGPFMKALYNKAVNFGMSVVMGDPFDFQNFQMPDNIGGIVIDHEDYTRKVIDLMIPKDTRDIDHSVTSGMSAAANATWYLLLTTSMISEKSIVIVGRSHAVQGLIDHLLDGDGTLTVCHSKTINLWDRMWGQNVVILAAPNLDRPIPTLGHELVIDLGNCVKYPDQFDCPYVNHIGPLTVSILLNRFAKQLVKGDG